jgi:cytochrome P450
MINLSINLAFLILAALLFALLYFFHRLIYVPWRLTHHLRSQGIVGVPFRPIVGNMKQYAAYNKAGKILDFYKDSLLEMQKLSGEKKVEIFYNQLGSGVKVYIIEPKLVQQIYKLNAMKFEKPRVYQRLMGQLMGTTNLVLGTEPMHSANRKLINPAFHYQNLLSMIGLMTSEVQLMMNNWKNGQITDLKHDFHDCALRVIARAAFGSGFDEDPDATAIILKATQNAFVLTQARMMTMIDIIPGLNKLPVAHKPEIDGYIARFHNFVDNLISQRRAGKSHSLCAGPDLLDQLIETNQLSDQQIKEECSTFIVAGHETTSNLLCWLFYELMRSPAVWAECVAEVDRILPDPRAEITAEQLQQLKFIDAVIKESLRLWPPVCIVNREAQEDVVITHREKKLFFPRNTDIGLNIFLMHRDNNLFPEAEKFDPWRWLEANKSAQPNLTNPFAYCPFAIGPRNCIGSNFALLESKIICAQIIRNFRMELEAGQKVVPEVIVTLRMRHGLKATIFPREESQVH